jgi:hypothetical protein
VTAVKRRSAQVAAIAVLGSAVVVVLLAWRALYIPDGQSALAAVFLVLWYLVALVVLAIGAFFVWVLAKARRAFRDLSAPPP